MNNNHHQQYETNNLIDDIYNNPEAVKHHYIHIGQNLQFSNRLSLLHTTTATTSSSKNIRAPSEEHNHTNVSPLIPIPLLLQQSRELRKETESTLALLHQ